MDNLVRIIVNNVVVIGEITYRTKRDIAVVILEPYEGFSNCRHIPCFATHEKDYAGEYGIETAKQLLNQIYSIYHEAELNAPLLSELVKQWYELKNEYNGQSILNRERRRKLREEFKNCDISQTTYQNSLHAMDKELTYLYNRLSDSFYKKIQPFFSEIIPFSNWEILFSHTKPY